MGTRYAKRGEAAVKTREEATSTVELASVSVSGRGKPMVAWGGDRLFSWRLPVTVTCVGFYRFIP